ncbi:tetratricopeptide repeat protein [Acanthopleuribacter pedis]|uniref:Tetratricopeptide repeat protein n=1 Tax=Acanthopleuribacter pedis TaxID=442870 RepID=A0A8J7Q5E7_9BACT|nr:tetratricopeptide repeat protein [Acanthopleuribacter pedis]MBO1318271.1 tetratricopeptide repeat protein [Acanthopleuribacter pedis]
MKLRRVLLVLCPFFVWNNVFAQPEFELHEPRPYTTGMNIARQYGPEKAFEYFDDCHEQTNNDMCFYGLAYTWQMMGENQKALEMVKLLLANPNLPDKFAGHCWALNGAALINMHKFEEAHESLKKALVLYQKAKHPRNQFRVLVQLGHGKLRSGDLEAADSYFERAAFIAISEDVGRGQLYTMMSISAYTQGKTEMARTFAELAFPEYERIGNRRGMVDAKAYIGFYLHELNWNEEAKKTLKEAHDLAEIFKTGPITWTVLVTAYINKCETPEKTQELIDTRLKDETDIFLRRFTELIKSKKCP